MSEVMMKREWRGLARYDSGWSVRCFLSQLFTVHVILVLFTPLDIGTTRDCINSQASYWQYTARSVMRNTLAYSLYLLTGQYAPSQSHPTSKL